MYILDPINRIRASHDVEFTLFEHGGLDIGELEMDRRDLILQCLSEGR